MSTINPTISRKLLSLAKESAAKAYAPYSKFHVGAALITVEDEYFSGCNVENASYGITLCAERNALSTMVSSGFNRFKVIAVYSPQSTLCYPCGACRQWLYELGGADAQVMVFDENETPQLTTVGELLPFAFGPDNLT